MAKILEGPQSSLQNLSLAQTGISHEGFANLMKAVKSNSSLLSLDFSENRLDGNLFS